MNTLDKIRKIIWAKDPKAIDLDLDDFQKVINLIYVAEACVYYYAPHRARICISHLKKSMEDLNKKE